MKDLILSSLNLSDFLWILFIILLIYYIIDYVVNWKNVPPGPWGLPFIGYLPFLGKSLPLALRALKHKYGDIYSLRLGQRFAVVLCSWQNASEAFIKQADLFSGRPLGFTKIGWFFNFKSIVAHEGTEFKEERRMLLRSFRDFGFGKLSLEGKIQEEAEEVISYFIEHKSSIDVPDILNIMTTNIICAIMFGKRYDYNDPRLRKLVRHLRRFMEAMDQSSLIELFPVLSFLPPKLLGLADLIEIKQDLKDFVDEIIEEHIRTFDENNLRDVVDDYLLKMKELNMNFTDEDNGTFYSRSYIRQNLITMFIGGTESTASTMYWAIKFLLIHPEIQKKVQQEIDSVIGRSRLPSWNDRINLPFTEATINEIHRMASIVPIGVIHSNTEEAFVNGFRIPKRSFAILNILEIHYDPTLWKDPEKFNPNRFLDENGKVLKPDYLIPFSIGPRQCIGNSFAKMELFVFFVSFLQNFSFTSDIEETENFEIINGLVRKVSPFPVNINQR